MDTRLSYRRFAAASGFTMLEMVTTLFLLAIVTAVGILNFQPFRDSFRRHTTRQNLDFDIHRAREEAVKAGARGILTVNSGGTSYTVGLDVYPFNSTGTIETTLFTRNLPHNFTLSASQSIIFDSRGFLIDASGAVTNTTLTLSDHGTQYLSGTVYPTAYVNFH